MDIHHYCQWRGGANCYYCGGLLRRKRLRRKMAEVEMEEVVGEVEKKERGEGGRGGLMRRPKRRQRRKEKTVERLVEGVLVNLFQPNFQDLTLHHR